MTMPHSIFCDLFGCKIKETPHWHVLRTCHIIPPVPCFNETTVYNIELLGTSYFLVYHSDSSVVTANNTTDEVEGNNGSPNVYFTYNLLFLSFCLFLD